MFIGKWSPLAIDASSALQKTGQVKKCMCEWGSHRDSEWPAAALTKFTFQYFFVLVARCGTGFTSILFCSLYRLQSSAGLNFTTVQWKAVNYGEFWYNQKGTAKLHKCLGSHLLWQIFFSLIINILFPEALYIAWQGNKFWGRFNFALFETVIVPNLYFLIYKMGRVMFLP